MLTNMMTPEDLEAALISSLRPLRARPSDTFVACLAKMTGGVALAGTAVVAVASAQIVGKSTMAIGSFAVGFAASVTAVGMSVGIALAAAHYQPTVRQDMVMTAEVGSAEELAKPEVKPGVDSEAEFQAVPPVTMDWGSETGDEPSRDTPSLRISGPSLPLAQQVASQSKPRDWKTLTESEQKSYVETVERWLGGPNKCQRLARQRRATDIFGKANVVLIIGTNGRAETVAFRSKGVREPELVACIERNIKRWQFVPKPQRIRYAFSLDFTPDYDK